MKKQKTYHDSPVIPVMVKEEVVDGSHNLPTCYRYKFDRPSQRDHIGVGGCMEQFPSNEDWKMEAVNTEVYDEFLTSLPERLPEFTINDDDFNTSPSSPMFSDDDHDILCDELNTQDFDKVFTPVKSVKKGLRKDLYKRSHTGYDEDETRPKKFKCEVDDEPEPSQQQHQLQMEWAQQQ